MATIFDIHRLRLPRISRIALVATVLVAALAVVGGYAGWRLYRALTTTTVTAYFHQTNALYPGDKVQIAGIRVGTIDSIEPEGDLMKVTFHFQNRYPVPADAKAVVLNPSLVASRSIQLTPTYTDGPTMADGAAIPLDRTEVPVEWDDLRNEITEIVSRLGPTDDQPRGPFGEVVESFADGLAGRGAQINTTLTGLADALTALHKGSDDFFGVVTSLAEFVNALHKNNRQFVALNRDLAEFTAKLTDSDQELAEAIRRIDHVLAVTRAFIDDNGSVLARDINNLAITTTAIMQPEPREGLETALHVLPNLAANLINIYEPAHGTLTGVPVVTFANPLQFFCSSIQAAGRLGYQESAELCAQYLTPILDAIKFNYAPFGMNLFNTASTLPNQIAYSEERLRPPPGFKDTTVPGVWARDTLFSHGNHEPGWKIAPGMAGLQLHPNTRKMIAPDDLAALMGTAEAGR